MAELEGLDCGGSASGRGRSGAEEDAAGVPPHAARARQRAKDSATKDNTVFFISILLINFKLQ
jgi:hypothetical protein